MLIHLGRLPHLKPFTWQNVTPARRVTRHGRLGNPPTSRINNHVNTRLKNELTWTGVFRVHTLLGFWHSMTFSITFQSFPWPKFYHLHKNFSKNNLDARLVAFCFAGKTCLGYLYLTIKIILHDFPWPTPKFHDVPGMENEIIKFHDFPGFPWPCISPVYLPGQVTPAPCKQVLSLPFSLCFHNFWFGPSDYFFNTNGLIQL